jgi:putative transposase
MPRRLRIHLANGFYHATLRGNHQQAIFNTAEDRRLLDVIVAESIERYAAEVHAYCWMTNHLHFLVRVGDEPLGHVMRQIASKYAKAFQRRLDTSGHLFERRYFARLVSADSYLMAVLRYIHLNPVAAKLAVTPADYPWSSHQAYSGGCAETWVTTDFVLSMFGAQRGSARSAYRSFIAEGDPTWLPDEVDTPLEATLRGAKAPKLKLPATDREPRRSLDVLLTEACRRFQISIVDLLSPSRRSRVVQARGWLSREAVAQGVASLSEVSRALGRDRSTLRHAMRQLEEGEAEPRLPLESQG